jgi:hypothetical protein
MPYQRRQWWYRGVRWTVYRWAKIRSIVVRTWRRIENIFPIKNGNGKHPPVEEQKEEVRKPGTNGSQPQPTLINTPPELPLPEPVERETEEKVLETEQPLDGK